jgi:hypothetical protein
MAYDLIEKWNRDPVIGLESGDLPSAVESLPEADCILLPEGAVTIASAKLPPEVKRDLDAALAGLLQAYREATPDAVIKYMSDRGKFVDPNLRKRMERPFRKQGIDELEKLTDEDIYRTMSTTFKVNAHWRGLLANSSCRQFWDGKNDVFNRVETFNTTFITGALTKEIVQADYLLHLFRGTMSGSRNFVTTAGSLKAAYDNDARVLLCDVQLVVELDESFKHAKVPYLIRFWLNDVLQKWQPIELMCFNSSPKGGPLPSAPF